mgnify:CR=1 FL=1
MNEGVVLSCIIGTNNTFSTDEINIIPDVYKLYLGETEQNIYLENNPVTINVPTLLSQMPTEKT